MFEVIICKALCLFYFVCLTEIACCVVRPKTPRKRSAFENWMGNHPGWVSGSPSSLGPLVEIRCGHERNFALKWIFKVWPKALLTSQFSASKFINCLLVISSPNCLLWLPNSVNKDFGPATRAGSSRRFLQSCGKGLTKLKQCPDRIGMSSPA